MNEADRTNSPRFFVMTETDILPAPILNIPPKMPTKFERERAAFRRLLPTLLKDYRNKYVAIHEEKVVGGGDDLSVWHTTHTTSSAISPSTWT
jgi:hypothetical protein